MNEKDQSLRHYWLYVLKCEQNKYYVGVTSKTPEIRMKEHVAGVRSAKWTMVYKPIKLVDQKDLGIMTYSDAEKYENKVIRAYVKKCGINNARGGDLRNPEDYVVHFGWIYIKEDWNTMVTIMSLMLIITILAVINCIRK